MAEDSNTLRSKGIELTAQGLGEAIDDFKKHWAKTRHSDSEAGKTLIEMAFYPLEEAIKMEQEKLRAGTRPRCWQELIASPADRLTYITLLSILDGFRGWEEDEKFTKLTALSKRIGDWARIQYKADREPEPIRARRVLSKLRDKNPSRAAKRYKPFSKMGFRGREYSIKLGAHLIDLAIKHGRGFFMESGGVKRSKRIRLTQKGFAVLERCRQDLEATVRPMLYPTFQPPLPWNGLEGGGFPYLDLALIKRDDDKKVHKLFKKADLHVVCEAVNAIQETPFRINQRVFKAMSEAVAKKSPLEVLPYLELVDMPARLPKATTPEPEWKERRRARRHAWILRSLVMRNLMALDTRLSIARRLGERELYFPHQVDLRGRAYPVPQEVHPQADDMSRSLIEFARGKPLGERGVFWLGVHLANLFGNKIDKLPLSKRVEWVRENEAAILDSATNPLNGGLFWAKADKKWRFLAAVIEWKGYLQEGLSYVSRLPIAMDGTCNGLQHLAALARDPVGGAKTNLMPSDAPQDLYQEVANRLQELVDEGAAGGDPDAAQWQGFIDRGLVKQATMTTPYGVTVSGIKSQVRKSIYENGVHRSRFPDPTRAAKYIGPLIQKAIGDVMPEASGLRTWLQELVGLLARQLKRGLSWEVPTGFPVLHAYWAEEMKRVETVRGKLLVWLENPRLGIRLHKQKNSIVPNLIHSLDAAHMMFTVRELVRRGLSDFSMVHDSYAVHACDVDLMQKVLREEFVRLHTVFTLEGFLKQVKRQSPALKLGKRHPVPPRGTLDLSQVLESDYFFS